MTNKKSWGLGITLWALLVAFIFYIPFIPQTVDKKVQTSFLAPSGAHNALVFFGFKGCSNVCPLTLAILQQLVDSLPAEVTPPQVIFVDIDEYSSSEEASTYAKQFHQSFYGYHVPQSELPQLSAQFGLNIEQFGSEISHLGKTYFLQRNAQEWQLVKAFNPSTFSVKILKKELNFKNKNFNAI